MISNTYWEMTSYSVQESDIRTHKGIQEKIEAVGFWQMKALQLQIKQVFTSIMHYIR